METYLYNMETDLSNKDSKISFSFVVLLIFAFLRPIFVGLPKLQSINLLDTFGIAISFLILIALITDIRKIQFDFITSMIFVLCFYWFLSILWGSYIREVARYTLPFLLFFLVRTSLTNNDQIALFLEYLIMGYSYLILASFFSIIMGSSETVYMYYSDYERYQGVTQGVHALAHSMMFFTFFFAFYLTMNKPKNKIIYPLAFVLFIISIYCLVLTYTRTVLFGFIIFWTCYLFPTNKKLFFILILMTLPLIVVFQDQAERVIFQDKNPQLNHIDEADLDHASSGRLTIWQMDLDILSRRELSEIFLGLGIGADGNEMYDPHRKFIQAHNDYLSIVMSSGIFGLIIYLIIFGTIFKKILSLNPITEKKYFFIAFFISILVMGFVSNSYVGRFEMTQYLWLFMGLIYAQAQIATGKDSRSRRM